MAKRVVPGSLTQPYKSKESDFSPNLVGRQVTSVNAFFTSGNFSLTTNSSALTSEFLNTGEFSEVLTLDNLNITLQQSVDINNETNSLSVKLKPKKRDLTSFVYFSDARKFIESEVLDVITKWKGGLYIRFSYINDTVTDFSYNSDKNISYFTLSKNIVENPFSLTIEDLPNLGTVNDVNDISFIQENFKNYQISNEFGNFDIIGYTGNSETSDYIKIQTNGLVWPTLENSGTTSGSFEYYLKPSKQSLNKYFYTQLSPFQKLLMDENTKPIYTITLTKPTQTSLGSDFINNEKFTWPLSDGYNIEYYGQRYADYLTRLLKFSAYFDSEITNIMVRRLVAKAIFEFDTAGDGQDPNSGRKMDKLMKIWGRQYDQVKTYIDNISFANVVTYDGEGNMPDELIKMMAKNLGFDTLQSFSSNKLIDFLIKTSDSVFREGDSGVTTSEMDLELWRRLIINAWWLWKSKGTRKVIEFFLNLFSIDECLVDLDEIVYVAESKLDYFSVINQIRDYYGLVPDDLILPIDQQGYPLILPNTADYYFQLDGFWYDGGVPENTKPDKKGNNPHFGPYDFGRAYFDKFRCFIPNFSPTTEIVNLNLLTFNYFTDYSLGTVEGTGETIITVDNDSIESTTTGNLLNTYNDFYATVMEEQDRVENAQILNAGSDNTNSNNGESSFHINFFAGNEQECITEFCPSETGYQLESPSGLVTYTEQATETEVFTLPLELEICCQNLGYDNYFNINEGTYPCYWCPPPDSIIENTLLDGNIRLEYIRPNGTQSNITDPQCCTNRGGGWYIPEGGNNPIGGVGGFVGLPYCKKNDPNNPADPNQAG
jgi:hypothetical protein